MAEPKKGVAAKVAAAPKKGSTAKATNGDEVLCPDCAGFGHFRAARKGGKPKTCGTCHGHGMIPKTPKRAARSARSSSSRGAKKRTRSASKKATPAKKADA